MWKKVAVGAAALVIAGSVMVDAQQRQGGFGGRAVPAERATSPEWAPAWAQEWLIGIRACRT